jgi:diacylglycerol kinase family enzyme
VQAAIVINRRAGCMRRSPRLGARLRALASGRARLYVTDSASELGDVAREIARAGVQRVGIVGGDGTASSTLTALWQAYGARALPQIALLRGGTMNTVASSLGLSDRPTPELLARLLRAPERARVLRRPVMIVGPQLGFLFGTGVWYGYLAETYRAGQPTRLHNARVLGRLLASAAVGGETYRRVLQPEPLSVRFADGAWEPRAYLAVAAATVAHAGFGFAPFHRALSVSDRFQLLAVQTGPRALLRDFPRLRTGGGLRPSTALCTLTPWAELESPGRTRFGYSVDGEIASAETGVLRITLGPTLELLAL